MSPEVRTRAASASRRTGTPVEADTLLIVLCPRCNYVGEPAMLKYDDLWEIISLLPYVGPLLRLLRRRNKEREGLVCSMCGYDTLYVLSEELARDRLGNARYEDYLQKSLQRRQNHERLSFLIAAIIAIIAIIALLYSRF